MIYLIALVIALAAAAFVVYPFFRRRDSSWEAEAEERPDDLRLKRQKLYDAVRELELERDTGSVSQDEYEKIRVSYETQAATLLMAEERQSGVRRRPPRKPAKVAASTTPPISHRLGLLIPAAVILFVGVGLGYFLSTSVKPRQSGVSITGGLPETERGAAPSALQEANAAFNRGELRQALDGYKKILGQNPHNVEALTQIGVILARARHYDDALLAFDQALNVRPNDPKALFEKGLVYFQGKVQPREGVKVWEHLIKTAPPDNEYAVTAKRMLDQVRASMGRPPSESPSPQTGK